MLFYLDQPSKLLGTILALVIGIYLGTVVSVLVSRLLGDPMPQRSGWLAPKPARHVSIFSAIAMVLAGVGWAEPVPMNDRWRARRFHVAAAVMARPLTYALLALAAVAALVPLTSDVLSDVAGRTTTATTLTGGFGAEVVAQMALTFAALCVASLIPCPPTDLGRAVFTLGGTSPGWSNARYQLEENNYGVGIVLALLLLPVLFTGFPSWVGQLAPQLIRGFGFLVGLPIG